MASILNHKGAILYESILPVGVDVCGCACTCVFVKVSCSQMWRTSILPTLKCNLVLWDRGWEKHTTGTQPYFSFSFTPFSFCVCFPFLLSNSQTFLLRLQISMPPSLHSLSIITILPLFPPFYSPSLSASPCLFPLLPDMGVRSSTVVSNRVMSHASIPKACLINRQPYWITEQTNFGPAENPLAISINTDTCMNACTHTHVMTCRQRQTCLYAHTHKCAQSEQHTLSKHVKKSTNI